MIMCDILHIMYYDTCIFTIYNIYVCMHVYTYIHTPSLCSVLFVEEWHNFSVRVAALVLCLRKLRLEGEVIRSVLRHFDMVMQTPNCFWIPSGTLSWSVFWLKWITMVNFHNSMIVHILCILKLPAWGKGVKMSRAVSSSHKFWFFFSLIGLCGGEEPPGCEKFYCIVRIIYFDVSTITEKRLANVLVNNRQINSMVTHHFTLW